MESPNSRNRLDTRILEALFREGPMSAPELAHHLQYPRLKSVDTALNFLAVRGQVQRVGLSNRFRLSPTQSALLAETLDDSTHQPSDTKVRLELSEGCA